MPPRRILLDPDPTTSGGDPHDASTPPEVPPPDPNARLIDDDILSALASDLSLVLDEKPPVAPPIKAAEDSQGTPPAPAKPAPAEKKPKVGIKEKPDIGKVVEEEVEKRLSQVRQTLPTPPPPAPPPAPAPAPPPPPSDDSSLTDEQRDELRDAEYASTVDTRYKGLPDKVRAFNRSLDEYVEKAREQDPDRTFDENDRQFIDWVRKNKPWNAKDRERVRIERIADEKAEAKLKARESEQEKRISRAEQEAREARHTPQIDKTLSAFESELKEETKTDDPLETDTYEEFARGASQLARDYMRLVHGLDTIGEHNPTEVQERHKWITQFITSSGEVFAKKGGEARKRDGKEFVTPIKFAQMRATNDPKLSSVWTFTAPDVLKMLRSQAVHLAKERIQQAVERNAKHGFVRQKQAAGSKSTEAPKATSGPKAGSTPAPGAADLKPANSEEHPGLELIEILELRK